MAIVKEIEGYPEYYVSSAGNVWREKNNGFFLKMRPNKRCQVALYTNGKCKYMLVHRLVATAFVPIPEKYQGIPIDELEIHHINFDHSDDRESNLMWLTKAEHMQLHSESDVTSLRKSYAKKGIQINRSDQSKPVAQYTTDGVFIAEYASVNEASRQTKVNQGNICSCCNGQRNFAGGFVWRYAS